MQILDFLLSQHQGDKGEKKNRREVEVVGEESLKSNAVSDELRFSPSYSIYI